MMLIPRDDLRPVPRPDRPQPQLRQATLNTRRRCRRNRPQAATHTRQASTLDFFPLPGARIGGRASAQGPVADQSACHQVQRLGDQMDRISVFGMTVGSSTTPTPTSAPMMEAASVAARGPCIAFSTRATTRPASHTSTPSSTA